MEVCAGADSLHSDIFRVEPILSTTSLVVSNFLSSVPEVDQDFMESYQNDNIG